MMDMKHYRVAFLAVLILGCTGYSAVTDTTYSRAYVYRPHSGPVDIFFGDLRPQRAYVEIGLIDIVGGQYHSTSDLVRKMQSRARAMGADAVIAIKTSHTTREETTLLDALAGNEPDVFTASVVTGIAIKYLQEPEP